MSTTKRRILVVANETANSPGLCDAVILAARRSPGAEVFVVSPAVNSRLRHWTSDLDQARAAAQARLEACVSRLASVGVPATGRIGDSDPLLALHDAVAEFPVAEIIISTHPKGRSHWLADNLVERARAETGCPVRHVFDHSADPPVGATVGPERRHKILPRIIGGARGQAGPRRGSDQTTAHR